LSSGGCDLPVCYLPIFVCSPSGPRSFPRDVLMPWRSMPIKWNLGDLTEHDGTARAPSVGITRCGMPAHPGHDMRDAQRHRASGMAGGQDCGVAAAADGSARTPRAGRHAAPNRAPGCRCARTGSATVRADNAPALHPRRALADPRRSTEDHPAGRLPKTRASAPACARCMAALHEGGIVQPQHRAIFSSTADGKIARRSARMPRDQKAPPPPWVFCAWRWHPPPPWCHRLFYLKIMGAARNGNLPASRSGRNAASTRCGCPGRWPPGSADHMVALRPPLKSSRAQAATRSSMSTGLRCTDAMAGTCARRSAARTSAAPVTMMTWQAGL